MRSHRLPIFTVLLTLTVADSASAQTPQLLTVFPPGGQRGKTVEVVSGGRNLAAVKVLFFSHPGITAQLISPNRFTVRIADDVPEGDHDVWAVTATGLSNPRRFVVSGLPEVAEKEKNDTLETAQAVPVPVVINGTLDPAADRDHYRFELTRGQHVSIAFRSETLEGTARPALTVFAEDGRELLHDDGRQAEPVLEFEASADGAYVVRVEERAYRLGVTNFYRLTLLTGPRLVAAFPDLLQKGKAQPVTLYGYELPGGKPAGARFPRGMHQVAVTIAAPPTGDADGGGWTTSSAVFLDGFRYRHPGVQGSVRLGLTERAVSVATDQAHDVPARAQPVTLPCAVAGRFLRPRQVDWYRFTAKKGQALWIEAVGERTGKAMDLDLAIHDAAGQLLQTLSDTVHPTVLPASCPLDTLDPMGVWVVPADGDYLLALRDLYGMVGVERTYRLALGQRQEEVCVVAVGGLSLTPGSSADLPLVAVRRLGQEAPIRIRTGALPAGVEIAEVVIPAKQYTGVLTVKVAKDAPPWVGKLPLVAETVIDGKPRTLPVVALMLVREGKPPLLRRCEAVVGAVVGAKP